MEPAASQTLPRFDAPACQTGCSDSPFLGTALELLEALRAEEQILKSFAGAELLTLLPRKEYLVNELEWELRDAREANDGSLPVSDSFRAVLVEIGRLNTSNGVFIERSLSYWQDLQAILSPPGYGPAGGKGKPYLSPPPGLTFRREV